MAFGLAASYQAPDYQTRAQAGLPVDPAMGDDAVSGLAATRLAQPVPPPQAVAQAYQPSWWDIAQGVLFDGQSPAEAAMAARQRAYQTQTSALMMRTLQHADPAELKALLTNPGKFGEEWSKNFAPVNAGPGSTEFMFGGPGVGGASFFAPSTGIDKESGKPYAFTQNGFSTLGPSLGGDFKATEGVISSGRTGGVAGTYSLPQILQAGSTPARFRPSVSGQGAPQVAMPGAAPATTDGGLDPISFFKSFVLPHEGGLNPRDLNGAPTKYGINQAANPGVDVTKLTPDDAARIFAYRFAKSGAGHLPPALAAVHSDTAFINPRKAAQILTQSGGDPAKYMDLREAWLNGLVQKFPAAQQYAKAWTQRNSDLRQFAALAGGGGELPPEWQVGAPVSGVRHLSPAEVKAGGYADGTVVERGPDGKDNVSQGPQYGADWAKGTRQQFLESEHYKQLGSASSALQALQHNIGQMTGPAAYTLLDTMARTINPGAVARQGTIAAIEDMLGVPAHITGALLNITGHGKIPLASQQAILDAVTPFAQSHWDQAKLLYDANSALAAAHKVSPEDVTAPIGERPLPMKVGPVPPAQQRQPGIYQTPKGLMKWTGTGWLKVN